MQIEPMVDRLFPFDTFNPGQREAIIRIVKAFLNGKKHFILEAPTGSGKSAIAYTVHKVLEEISRANHKRFRTTIVAPNHNLQNQYLNSFSIENLNGKKNYPCIKGADFYNSGSCRTIVLGGGCVARKECPYVLARDHWSNVADFRLTNTSMQIEMCDMVCNKPWNRANLIVIDESHNLEDALIEHCSVKINMRDFEKLKKHGYDEFLADMRTLINAFSGITIGKPFVISKIQTLSKTIKEIGLHTKCEALVNELLSKTKDDQISDATRREMYALLEEAQQITDKLRILGDGTLNTVILHEFERSTALVLKPVLAGEVSWFGMFRKATFFLHMSSTIIGEEEYRKTLRIGKNSEFFSMDNSIPKQNRRIFLCKDIKVSNGHYVRDLPKFVNLVCKKHEGERGIIHTVSYKLAEEILEYCENDRLVICRDPKTAVAMLLEKPDTVLVSPSIEEGVDFKDDLSRFQIIAKTPYLFLGDPLIKLKCDDNPNWYNRKTIIRLIQMCGRSVRGVDDYAKTYIADNTSIRTIKNGLSYIPNWFFEAMSIDNVNSDRFRNF